MVKKKRDEVRFRQAQLEIELMKDDVERDERILAFVDETGFALAQPNRSAWAPIGKCHKIDANRGKRLNVIGSCSQRVICSQLRCGKQQIHLYLPAFLVC